MGRIWFETTRCAVLSWVQAALGLGLLWSPLVVAVAVAADGPVLPALARIAWDSATADPHQELARPRQRPRQ